jgi:hypothetical protein
MAFRNISSKLGAGGAIVTDSCGSSSSCAAVDWVFDSGGIESE